MANYTIKKIADMETGFGGALRKARAELGVTAFGIAIEDFPPNADQYPEHDHASDGQEEVYVVVSGSGEIEIEGERHPLDTETVVRVGPGTNRKLFSGDQGMRLIAVGGVPGKAYEPPEFSQLETPGSSG